LIESIESASIESASIESESDAVKAGGISSYVSSNALGLRLFKTLVKVEVLVSISVSPIILRDCMNGRIIDFRSSIVI
jgi:hypothetical protein